ncbi:hypothetical protein M758_12G036100 [Ceratodon purpureus]|nr:hypothetical protein M758_12G036100 [Ceratodon purpureus]
MAEKYSLVTEPVVFIMIVVVLMAMPPVVEANMDVIFYNNLNNNKMVMMHCYSNIRDNPPARIFGPTQSFWAFSLLDKGGPGDYTKRNWAGIRYWCEFQADTKPTKVVLPINHVGALECFVVGP